VPVPFRGFEFIPKADSDFKSPFVSQGVHVHSAQGKHLARENRRAQYEFRPGARAPPARRKKYAGDFLNKVTTFSAGTDLAAIENDTGIVGE